jgi:hypothetical protein
MPGTSTTGVHRLKMWTFALLVGAAAVLVSSMPVWATSTSGASLAPAAASGTVADAGGGGVAEVDVDADAGGIVDVEAGGVVDVDAGGVAGQAAGVATDLSVESVSAPPAAVPWILVALLVLVVAGAVRAYSRSPQRAAIRSRRNPR